MSRTRLDSIDQSTMIMRKEEQYLSFRNHSEVMIVSKWANRNFFNFFYKRFFDDIEVEKLPDKVKLEIESSGNH